MRFPSWFRGISRLLRRDSFLRDRIRRTRRTLLIRPIRDRTPARIRIRVLIRIRDLIRSRDRIRADRTLERLGFNPLEVFAPK